MRDKPAAMLALSPKGTVPVLQTGMGRLIEESLDIMDWALGESDPDGWLGCRDDPRLNRILDANDGPFKRALDRYKYPHRYPDEDTSGQREVAVSFLAPIDAVLKDAPSTANGAPAYLGGRAPGFFDAAVFPFVRQFAAVEPSWFGGLPYPALVSWHQAMLAHPVFTRVMSKLKPWKPGDVPFGFRTALQNNQTR